MGSNDIPANIKEHLEELFGDKSGFEERISQDTFLDVISSPIEVFTYILEDKEKLKKLLEVVPYIFLFQEDLVKKTPYVIVPLYNSIQNQLENSYVVDSENTKMVCNDFNSSFNSKFPLDKILFSLLIVQNKILKFFELLTKTPLGEFEEQITKTFDELIE